MKAICVEDGATGPDNSLQMGVVERHFFGALFSAMCLGRRSSSWIREPRSRQGPRREQKRRQHQQARDKVSKGARKRKKKSIFVIIFDVAVANASSPPTLFVHRVHGNFQEGGRVSKEKKKKRKRTSQMRRYSRKKAEDLSKMCPADFSPLAPSFGSDPYLH